MLSAIKQYLVDEVVKSSLEFWIPSLILDSSLKNSELLFHNHLEWPVSNFSLQYHLWIIHYGHKNDHQLKKLLIVKQIFPAGTIGNVFKKKHGEVRV